MGFIRKLTGAQGKIDAMQKQADAQIAAQNAAADAQAAATRDAAVASADSRVQAIQREALSKQVAEAELSAEPVNAPEVRVDGVDPEQSAAGKKRKLRATFGTGYSTGVSI